MYRQVPSEKRALPATMIQNSAVRHTVQSMARLMAAYFCNRELFIYPAHAPRKLPPLHVLINSTGMEIDSDLWIYEVPYWYN